VTNVLPHLKGLTLTHILSAALFFLLLPSVCFAESTATSEWNISADKITRLDNPERIIAEGSIVLEKREKIPPQPPKRQPQVSDWSTLLEEEVDEEGLTPDELPQQQKPTFETAAVIKADHVSYNVEEQSITARGNVSIDTGDDQLFAEKAQIDLATETGVFENALITRKKHQLHLEGSAVEKTGTKTYRIEDGWVITCRIEDGKTPPWSFSSAEATIEQGGYAILKHAKFNVRNVPIFYLPYLIVPVKDTRQTGFLFPEISNSSRDGFGFNMPFFLNVSESIDVTLYPEYYVERGFMPGAEFRYMISAEDKGQFMGSYLDDQLGDSEEAVFADGPAATFIDSERYWFRGKLDHTFASDWITRLDVDVVSDRDYLEEFSSGVTGFNTTQKKYLSTFGRGFENQSDDQRRNTLKLLKAWSGSSLNIDLLAINDARAVETAPTPLWKLPSVQYAGALPFNDSTFTLEWDADYVNYWRDDGIGGHRLDLFPRFSTPVPVGPYLESRAEIGGRGTFYAVEEYGDALWTEDETPNRLLFNFHTDLATTLVRDFNLGTANYSHLAHSIRPFIEYDFIPETDQDDLPRFDSIDRIGETNAITYGVDTFFDLFKTEDSLARQYGFVRLEQSYDLRSEASGERFSPVTLKLGWEPLSKLLVFYKAEIPIEDDDNTTHGLEGYFTNSRGDRFTLDYRFNDDQDIEQINASFDAMIMPQIRAGLDIEHSISQSETNEAIFALTYLAQCWSVQLNTRYSPTDERVMLVFNLANIGTPLGISF